MRFTEVLSLGHVTLIFGVAGTRILPRHHLSSLGRIYIIIFLFWVVRKPWHILREYLWPHVVARLDNCEPSVGFIAVSSDEATRQLGRRDIIITFRGTVTSQEWVANFMSSLIPAQLDPHNPRPDVKVESGFLSLYTSDESSTSRFGILSCREQLLSEISRLLKKYKGEGKELLGQ